MEIRQVHFKPVDSDEEKVLEIIVAKVAPRQFMKTERGEYFFTGEAKLFQKFLAIVEMIKLDLDRAAELLK